jgi:predicted enzyme related to lactoylglutathione lyase
VFDQPLALWQEPGAIRDKGGETMNTFDWIEIRTRDIDRTMTFYAGLFGWKVIQKEMVGGSAVWIFDTNEEPRLQNLRRGGIWARSGNESQGFVVYIVVQNIDVTMKQAQVFGGRVIESIIDVGGGFIALIEDTDGNRLGLYQDKSSG